MERAPKRELQHHSRNLWRPSEHSRNPLRLEDFGRKPLRTTEISDVENLEDYSNICIRIDTSRTTREIPDETAGSENIQ
jgi:hypothetical protein